MSKPHKTDVLGILLDIAESSPNLARLLAFVEPTKSVYRLMEMTEDLRKTLARMLAGGGLASIETTSVVDKHHRQSEVSPHSSRELPDWQVNQQ